MQNFNAEMIENKGGFVVSVGDVEAMASAFDAMQNPAMRRNMSAWNIEKVRSCYTVEAVFNGHIVTQTGQTAGLLATENDAVFNAEIPQGGSVGFSEQSNT